MQDSTTFTDDELASLEALRERHVRERVWKRLEPRVFDAARYKRENRRCSSCLVKTYAEDMAFGLCPACVSEMRCKGRLCEQHGVLPVRVMWLDRARDEYELVVMACPICALLGVA